MLQKRHLYTCFLLLFISQYTCAQRRVVYGSQYQPLYEKMARQTYDDWRKPKLNTELPFVIRILSQKDFDDAENLILNALKAGRKNIVIEFGKGPYYSKSEHITIKGGSYPNSSIHLTGDNTIIIPTGKNYKKGEEYDGVFSAKNIYLDSEFKDMIIWSQMYHSDSIVEVLNADEKLCRIHSPEFNLSNEAISQESFIQLTEWYLCGIYKVTKIEGNNVYFIASDLKPGLSPYGNYNVNYDYTVVKVYPRFRVCNLNDATSKVNLHLGKPVEKDFYECTGNTFLKLYWTELLSLDVTGFKFYGNAGNGMLLSLLGAKTKSGIKVSDCEFRNIKSVAIYMMQTSDVIVSNNYFEDCYTNVILAIDQVKNTIVTDNYFHNVGKELSSSFAILCQSSNFYVARNMIVNFGLGGIGVGKDESEGYEAGSGIIEDNVLYYTDEHHNWSAKNGLIDGGAIYLKTRNEGTTVRYNRIHNYTGAHSNRGVYCDDGAFGFSIYGNVITGITNSNCIDSRRVPSLKSPTNTNNVIMYNIVEGRYKFEGSKNARNDCVKGKNIVLSLADTPPPKIVLGNIDKIEDDVNLEYKKNEELSIIVPRSTSWELKKLPVYGRIKKYIKVR